MKKKRAFVRYTKSGEIVPGSLIITTNGGYPDKSSLWKEVTADQCCDTSCIYIRDVNDLTYPFNGTVIFQINVSLCENNILEYFFGYVINSTVTLENNFDLIKLLNDKLFNVGTFYISGENEISLKISSNMSYLCKCEGAPLNDSISIIFFTGGQPLNQIFQIIN